MGPSQASISFKKGKACLGSVGACGAGSEHVLAVLSVNVTGRRVVADSEGQGGTGVDVAQAVAGNSGAGDVGGTLPDDLGEVAPLVEVGHAGVGSTVGGREEFDLIVVHQVGDHGAHIARINAVADVLAVATTINRAV